MAMPGTHFTLRFALALALACFAVANGTDEQVTPDSDTPLAPTRKDENRQLRTELDQMHSTMKATEEGHGKEMKATKERHGKEIAKLKTLVHANMQSEPRAKANATNEGLSNEMAHEAATPSASVLRAELSALKLGGLNRRAVAANVDPDALEMAQDNGDKAAIIELVLQSNKPLASNSVGDVLDVGGGRRRKSKGSSRRRKSKGSSRRRK